MCDQCVDMTCVDIVVPCSKEGVQPKTLYHSLVSREATLCRDTPFGNCLLSTDVHESMSQICHCTLKGMDCTDCEPDL